MTGRPQDTVLLDTVKTLDSLIGFPTVSADSNLSLIEYAAERLSAAGATLTYTKDSSGTKANLFASIGPDEAGGVVLSGHTDVVPVEGQDWHSDPFVATHVGDRIHGRGSCDMKGFIAAALAMAPSFAKRNLRRPVHFAFTFDEEVGCLGAPILIDDLAARGVQPSIAIVGEPTDMRIIEGHKGCYEYTTRIRGLEGHGSMPDAGVNAVHYAVRMISELLAAGETLKSAASPDSPFDPPWTTVSVGSIRGGIARNVIPKDCAFEWEMRPLQVSDSAAVWARINALVDGELLPQMRAIYPESSIVTETIGEVPGLEVIPESEATALARKLTGGNETGLVSFGTEAGMFQNAGVATVVCGPGSIDQAHRPDEYVTTGQLNACLGMLDRLGDRLTQPV
jgi:acetylornithine deacetylase